MHNHTFMWARELTRSRTKYRLGSCKISYEISFGICKISYEISFGILRDFIRDIVWDFVRSRTKHNGPDFVTNVNNTESKRALITGTWS